MVRHTFILSIIILMVSGCYEQNIEFEGPDAETRLSAYAVLRPNTTPKFEFYLAIKASSASTDSKEYLIRVGKGVFYENDQYLDSIIYDQPEECFQLKNRSLVKSGSRYFFDFYGPDDLRVKSEVVSIPSASPAIELTLDTMDCIVLTNDFIGCKLNIQFLDSTGNLLWQYLPLPRLERVGFPQISSVNGGNIVCRQKSYSDQMIISRDCTRFGAISYYIPYRLEGNQVYSKDRYEQYRVSIGNISDSYYHYLNNLADQFDYDLAISIDPVITYTNMVEGLGVLAAVNDTMIIVHPK